MDITKYLIQQDGTTNKFWHIETHGHIQTIHWGRIDTKGRMAEKEFDDSESCQMDSEKLIAQKLRKGYVEAANAQAVPEKRELTEEEQGKLSSGMPSIDLTSGRKPIGQNTTLTSILKTSLHCWPKRVKSRLFFLSVICKLTSIGSIRRTSPSSALF